MTLRLATAQDARQALIAAAADALGGELGVDPPAPDSPLAQLIADAEAVERGEMSREEAIKRCRERQRVAMLADPERS